MTENLRGYPYKDTHTRAASCTEFSIDTETHSFYPLVQRESNLILIFMIIKENMGNHRKFAEKLMGYTYKITNTQLLIAIEKQTWYKNNARALIICSLLEISELQNYQY